jgi:chromosome segregation ATPase
MFTALIYFLFLMLITALGFVIGYLVWGKVHPEDIMEKSSSIRQELFHDNPMAKEIITRMEENRQLILARTGDLQTLTADTADAERQIVGLERRVAQASTSLAVYEGEVRELRVTLRDKEQLASEMRQKIAAAEAAAAERADDLQALRRTINTKDQLLVELEKRIAAAEKGGSERGEEIKTLQADISRNEKEINTRSQEVSALKKAEKDKSGDLEKERIILESLRKELDAAGAAMAETQQEVLYNRKGVADGKEKLRSVTVEITDSGERIRSLEAGLAGVRERVQGANQDLTKLDKDKGQKQSELIALIEKADRAEMALSRGEGLTDLRAELAELEKKLDALSAQQAERRSRLHLWRQNLEDARASAEQVAEEAESIRIYADSVKNEVGNLRGALKDKENAVKGATNEVDAVTQRIREKENRLRGLQDKLNACERSITTLGPQADELTRMHREGLVNLERERERVARLEIQVREMRRKLEILRGLEGERQRVERIEGTLQEYHKKLDQMRTHTTESGGPKKGA